MLPSKEVDVQEESMIQVVTFSGVTSGGIVTSGTTCCTCMGKMDEEEGAIRCRSEVQQGIKI
jgi:hypothetical protein